MRAKSLPRAVLRTLLPGMQRSSRIAFASGFGLGLLVLLALSVYAVWGPESNPVQAFFTRQETTSLREGLENQRKANLDLKEEVARADELLKLDREERNKLTLMIANLEAENARLKDDLAFFEGFIPGNQEAKSIALRRFQVSRDTVPNQYRYRALLIQSSDNPPANLNVQLLVKVLNNDKPAVIVLPTDPNISDPQFKIRLTRISKVAGTFVLPADASLQGIELRILEGTSIRAQASTKL